jgi:phage-related protein
MELFKLVGSIFIKSEDANEEIDKVKGKAKGLAESIGNTMQNVGEKVTNVGQKMLPVTVAIGGVGIASVKASAELKAMNSQFEQTFGELQNQASQAMNAVATESGILQTRLQGVGTSIYAFAKSSGADSAEAMELMETALRATADASAYYDRSLEDTSESLMSFLKGNFANDAQLGVSCTETTRNAKAMELFGKEYNELSEIQKQQTLLKMVTDAQKLSGAMGQAQREADGFENVTGNLKESVKLLGAELGAVLLPTVIDLVQKATAFLQKITQMDDETKKMVVTAGLVVGAIAPVLIVLGKIISSVGTMIVVIPKIVSGVKTIGTGLKALWGIMSANPIGLIITIIGVLVAVFIHFWNTSEEFRNFWKGLWEDIKRLCSNAIEAIKGFFQKIINFVKGNWQGLLLLLVNPFAGAFKLIYDNCEGVRNKVNDVFNKIKTTVSNAIANVKNSISNGMTNAKNTVTNTLNNIGNKFTSIMNTAKNVVSNAVNAIRSAFKFSWSLPKPKLPKFAVSGGKAPWGFMGKGSLPKVSVSWFKHGGIMTEPTLFDFNPVTGHAKVGGEAGAEAIAPIDLLQGYVAEAVASQNGGLVTVLLKILDAIIELDENMGGHMRDALHGTSLEMNKREFARLVKVVS